MMITMAFIGWWLKSIDNDELTADMKLACFYHNSIQVMQYNAIYGVSLSYQSLPYTSLHIKNEKD